MILNFKLLNVIIGVLILQYNRIPLCTSNFLNEKWAHFLIINHIINHLTVEEFV